MHSLVFGMTVTSCCSHSPWLDMVGDDLATFHKRAVADLALPALLGDFPVEHTGL